MEKLSKKKDKKKKGGSVDKAEGDEGNEKDKPE